MDSSHAAGVVVLTALNLEYASVRRLLSDVRRASHPAGTLFETGRLPGSGGRVAIAVTGAGNTAAAVVAERAIAMFRPVALLFVGVAGALHDDLVLGDVLVATKVYAYHSGSVYLDTFQPRPRSWEPPHRLEQIARHVSRMGGFRQPLEPGRPPSIRFAPIASGELVVQGREHLIAHHLFSAYADAAAVDMESAGAAQAGHLNDIPVLVVRGISDHADGAKHAADRQGWQPVAAANAAAFALAVAAELNAAGTQPSAAAAQVSAVAARAPDVVWQVPRQLPARGGLLVGRQTELERLDEVLLGPVGDRPRVALLTGMAGVGKTAVAVHWAHRAAGAFPDGVLYADARGFGPDRALDPGELLAGFLRALGQERGAELGSADERAARLRTALSGRRVLIVLDNVGTVDQVRAIVPGDGSSAVLATSRERLRGLSVRYGAPVVRVDPLSPAGAVALLRDILGERANADTDGVVALASRCAGLPLALCIAAERASSLPSQRLGELADEIGVDGATLDQLDTGDDAYSAVWTVFSWSYRGLVEPAAAAFRLLSLHPGTTFGLAVAAALAGTPVRPAAALLRVLVNAHLVVESQDHRYEMHDLVRGYARQLCEQSDSDTTRAAARRRMYDQYLYAADRANRVIMPYRYRPALDEEPTVELDFDSREAALGWLDLDRRNLVEICKLDDTGVDTRRWRLAYALRDYFYLTKYVDCWIETHRHALAGCRRIGDRRAEGITRNNLGRALLESGDLDGAAEQYRLAHGLHTEAGDEHGATDALVNLASVLRRHGDFDEALGYLHTALSVYRKAELPRKVGITLRSIARIELAGGRFDAAAQHAEQALAEFTGLGLDLDAAQTLNTLTRIHQQRGDLDVAETTGRSALAHCHRANSSYERARVLHTLGAVAVVSGEPAIAEQRWTDAVTILRTLGAPLARVVESDLAALRSVPAPSRRTVRVSGHQESTRVDNATANGHGRSIGPISRGPG